MMMNTGQFSEPPPCLTTEQMVEVDRAMVEDFHIELAQMMENAGRNLAHLTGELYLADISVPPALYARPPLNLSVGPLFAAGEIVRL